MTTTTVSRRARGRRIVARLGLLLTLLPLLYSVTPSSAGAGASRFGFETKVYVEQTGQTINGAFLDFWLSHQTIGLPVSPVVRHGEHWNQWFEYGRLELRWVPLEVAGESDITLLPLGNLFAEDAGYARRLDAFAPRQDGGERFFQNTGHSISNGFRAAHENEGVAGRLGSPISEEFTVAGTTYQFFEYGAMNWTSETGVTIMPLGRLDAAMHGQLAQPQPQSEGAISFDLALAISDSSEYDSIDLPAAVALLATRGESAYALGSFDFIELADRFPGERWIEIDLTTYTVTAWVGDIPVLRTISIVGSLYSPTPTGHFSIYLMNDVQTLSGIGWDGNPFYEPDVPWVMYFYEDYAIHSSTWRSQFGYSDSQGCVIPPALAAEELYDFAYYGMYVWVHY